MRRDEFLKKRKAEEANKIPKDILYEVANQWSAAGFKHDELLDENNNWYLEDAPTALDASEVNSIFKKMCDFWRRELNYGINALEKRWYNKDEAYILAEQFINKCVEQDCFPKNTIISFSNQSNRTIKGAIVVDGWTKKTLSRSKRLFSKALAATILDDILYWYNELRIKYDSYDKWHNEQIEKAQDPFLSYMRPQPYFYDGNADHVIECVGDKRYICNDIMPTIFFIRYAINRLDNAWFWCLFAVVSIAFCLICFSM